MMNTYGIFKQNRSKSLLVPVWSSYEDTLINGRRTGGLRPESGVYGSLRLC